MHAVEEQSPWSVGCGLRANLAVVESEGGPAAGGCAAKGTAGARNNELATGHGRRTRRKGAVGGRGGRVAGSGSGRCASASDRVDDSRAHVNDANPVLAGIR